MAGEVAERLNDEGVDQAADFVDGQLDRSAVVGSSAAPAASAAQIGRTVRAAGARW
jgi:hypothetical protein